MPGQETGKHQAHAQGAMQETQALPTVVRPAHGQAVFWLAGMMGSSSANTSSCTQLWFPLCPPQHPKDEQGQGKPGSGCPTSTILLKAGEKNLQALSPQNNATGCLERAVRAASCVCRCRALGFKPFSPPRDVRREGGHGHAVSHPHHHTRADLGTDLPWCSPRSPRTSSLGASHTQSCLEAACF